MVSLLVSSAAAFAEKQHEGQVDKSGAEYFGHAARVAKLVQSVPSFAEFSDYEKEAVVSAAYLHDVVEDCGVSVAEVAEKFSPAVALVVALVSKNVQKSASAVAANKYARAVKLADVADNSNKVRVAVLKAKNVGFNFNKYPEYLAQFNLSVEESAWFEAAIQ